MLVSEVLVVMFSGKTVFMLSETAFGEGQVSRFVPAVVSFAINNI
jgi:hypothetical protein